MRLKGSPILSKVLYTVKNAAISFSLSGGATSRAAYQAFRRFDELQETSSQQLRDTVRHAIRNKYIVITGSGSTRHIRLTGKGQKLVQKMALEQLHPERPRMWDKKWRIVLFDVPESSRKGRNSFAVGLKRMGFVQIQKSCFAFPFPCFEEVAVLADFCEVRPYTKGIVAEQMEGAERLLKQFKLSKI